MTDNYYSTATQKHPIIKGIKISKYIYLAIVAILPIAAIVLPLLLTLSVGLLSVINGLANNKPFEDAKMTALIQILLLLHIYVGCIPMILGIAILAIGAVSIIFSALQIPLLCIFNRRPKILPVVIIFRILTVLFGIATIICTVLLFTQTICVYDFLRTVVFFFGGSIVLNLAVE
jgi:hypothetical protein